MFSMAGLYTCVATLSNPTMSLNTTVDVNIGGRSCPYFVGYNQYLSSVL